MFSQGLRGNSKSRLSARSKEHGVIDGDDLIHSADSRPGNYFPFLISPKGAIYESESIFLSKALRRGAGVASGKHR